MLAWVIEISIISFVFIFLVHHTFIFLKDTLTPPKIRDLVDFPARYNTICSLSGATPNQPTTDIENNMSQCTTNIYDLPVESSADNMKTQLKDFLKGKV
jgi:hypothetical protein